MPRIMLTVGLILGSMGAIAPIAIADQPVTTSQSMADLPLPTQVTSLPTTPDNSGQTLSQLFPPGNFSDVSVNHWAYSAVNNLSEDYGCLAGYPDGTFRGEEFVTRYEFAAALETCLDSVVQLIEQPPQAEIDQILTDLEALNRELGTLSDDIGEQESESLRE